MAIILNIDTSTEKASICIGNKGENIGYAFNPTQKDHAAWLQPAIEQLLREAGLKMQDLNAVAITEGPGSYTGLRVAMASAKGLCYALDIPLITENTLTVMAKAVLDDDMKTPPSTLLCPMIDARRMEVFTALYDINLQLIMPAQAMVLDENSFNTELEKQSILFTGNGSGKWQKILHHSNAEFRNIEFSAINLSALSYQKYLLKNFTDLAYSEPFYLKNFFDTTKK